ncbi:MAG: SGNH/GDSL hydrolase family protein [Clostridia bacterium]|nr:SGNH/GDSL hydrolase family protein [Clostridia bacterium]
MRKKRIFSIVFALALLGAILAFFSRLLMPKHVSMVREGALVGEYYIEADEGREHQILFLGDCEAYGCFIPAIIWEASGLTSYVRGSPAARVWQSYYLLLDTLEYEKPDVVVLSVFALCHGDAQSEAYNRLALDGMRLSKNKINAVKASMSEDEILISYIFPLLRYHSRWSELRREDIDYLFAREAVSHNGYLFESGSRAPDTEQSPEELFDYSLPDRAIEYLDKIRLCCEERGIALVLVKSPTQSGHYWWYDEWDARVREYAERYRLDYYNLIGSEEIGIDGGDYADGVHLNFLGAEKTSRYFGKVLKEKYFPSAAPHGEETKRVWKDKLDKYYIERNKFSEGEK